MAGGQFSIGHHTTGGLPSFKTGRIANGTGDASMGRRDGTGPKDQGEGKSDRASPGDKKRKLKRPKRRKVNIKKIKGL